MDLNRFKRIKGNWFVGLPLSGMPMDPRAMDDVPARVRPFHPLDVHLTVCFLGRLDVARIPRVCAIMKEIDFAPFEATFGSLIPLPHRKRFSAISLELNDGRRAAAAVIEQWREKLALAAGVRPDNRPALPHATIARPHRKATKAEQAEILDWMASITPSNQSVIIDRVALFTWAEDRTKRQFQIVKETIMSR